MTPGPHSARSVQSVSSSPRSARSARQNGSGVPSSIASSSRSKKSSFTNKSIASNPRSAGGNRPIAESRANSFDASSAHSPSYSEEFDDESHQQSKALSTAKAHLKADAESESDASYSDEFNDESNQQSKLQTNVGAHQVGGSRDEPASVASEEYSEDGFGSESAGEDGRSAVESVPEGNGNELGPARGEDPYVGEAEEEERGGISGHGLEEEGTRTLGAEDDDEADSVATNELLPPKAQESLAAHLEAAQTDEQTQEQSAKQFVNELEKGGEEQEKEEQQDVREEQEDAELQSRLRLLREELAAVERLQREAGGGGLDADAVGEADAEEDGANRKPVKRCPATQALKAAETVQRDAERLLQAKEELIAERIAAARLRRVEEQAQEAQRRALELDVEAEVERRLAALEAEEVSAAAQMPSNMFHASSFERQPIDGQAQAQNIMDCHVAIPRNDEVHRSASHNRTDSAGCIASSGRNAKQVPGANRGPSSGRRHSVTRDHSVSQGRSASRSNSASPGSRRSHGQHASRGRGARRSDSAGRSTRSGHDGNRSVSRDGSISRHRSGSHRSRSASAEESIRTVESHDETGRMEDTPNANVGNAQSNIRSRSGSSNASRAQNASRSRSRSLSPSLSVAESIRTSKSHGDPRQDRDSPKANNISVDSMHHRRCSNSRSRSRSGSGDGRGDRSRSRSAGRNNTLVRSGSRSRSASAGESIVTEESIRRGDGTGSDEAIRDRSHSQSRSMSTAKSSRSPEAAVGSAAEEKIWEVLRDKINVRKSQSLSSEVLAVKSKGEKVRGVQMGDWVALASDLSFMRRTSARTGEAVLAIFEDESHPLAADVNDLADEMLNEALEDLVAELQGSAWCEGWRAKILSLV